MGWKGLIDVKFVKNRLERDILASRMEVYVSTWLTKALIAQSPRLKWVHLTLSGVEFLSNLDIPANLKITTVDGGCERGCGTCHRAYDCIG